MDQDFKISLKNCEKEIQLCTPEAFWSIIDLLHEEYLYNQRGFYCNRDRLLKAYSEHRFFVLACKETDDIFETDLGHKLRQHICLKNAGWYLPSFCILSHNSVESLDFSNSVILIELIWTSEPIRRLGLASEFIKYFNITKVDNILEESIPFWSKFDVKYSKILTTKNNDISFWIDHIKRLSKILDEVIINYTFKKK